MKRKISYLFLNLILLLLSGECIQAQKGEEYLLKSACMERFTRFIDWPASSGMSDTSKPFIIGVIGENPFKEELNHLASINKIKNKAIEILYLKDIAGSTRCNLLFIPKSMKKETAEIISHTQRKPILTVSEVDGAAGKGVIINFIIVDNKLSFEINETAARDSGLKISYILLQMSKIVKPGK